MHDENSIESIRDDSELTEREREILDLVIAGMTNKEIGQQLYISPNTVKIHVSRILRKAGASSRTEAATMFLRKPDSTQPFDEYDSIGTQKVVKSEKEQKRVKYFLLIAIILGVLFSTFTLINSMSSPTTSADIENRKVFSTQLQEIEMGGAVYQGNLYLISHESGGPVINQMDLTNGHFSFVTRIPTAISNISISILRGSIYILGGKNADGSASGHLWVYFLDTGEWQEKQRMINPVWSYASETLEGKLYVFGGENQDGLSSSVTVYDPSLDKWTQIGNLITPRSQLGSVVLNESFYLIGGAGNETDLKSVERFSLEGGHGGTSEIVGNMLLPCTCLNCSATVNNSTILVYLENDLLRYNFQKLAWENELLINHAADKNNFIVGYESSFFLIEQNVRGNYDIIWLLPEYRISLPLLLNN